MDRILIEHKKTIKLFYEENLESIKSNILKESKEQIIGSDTSELAEYYCSLYKIQKIEFDKSNGMHFEQKEQEIRSVPVYVKVNNQVKHTKNRETIFERLKVNFPIVKNSFFNILSSLKPSTFLTNPFQLIIHWEAIMLYFEVETKNEERVLSSEKIEEIIRKEKEYLEKYVDCMNVDLEKHYKEMYENVKILIDERKTGIKKDEVDMKRLAEIFNVPLKKEIPEGVQNIILSKKPIVERIKPNPKLPEEYFLDEQKVIDILEFIDDYVKSLEKTPIATKPLEEEDFRDLLLASLNCIFKGKATGETFSNKGKTDIYLNINQGNILVFECKFWDGEKVLLGTIKQLQGYLTWRLNYGVVVIFSRNKNFTKILSEVPEFIQKSESYKNSYQKMNETHFSAIHRMEDEDKEVKIHYLFYNLYCETK